MSEDLFQTEDILSICETLILHVNMQCWWLGWTPSSGFRAATALAGRIVNFTFAPDYPNTHWKQQIFQWKDRFDRSYSVQYFEKG